MRMARERALRDLLHDAFRRSGLVRGVQRAEAVIAWRRVAGPEVARFASAAALQHGTLVVDVPDPETALHLGLQRHHLLRAYAEQLGPDVVREIRFRVGRPAPEEAREAPSQAHVPADPRALAALARDLQAVPEGVAGPALQAGAALLGLQARRRAAGWQPCPVCGVLREPPPPTSSVGRSTGPADDRSWCPICTRHAGHPKVRRQAERLADDPDLATPLLSDDERMVARCVARDLAAERVLAALPHVLADPGGRPALERLARIQAALSAGVPLASVHDDHLAVVDARVLRALGRWAITRPTPEKEPHP